MKVFKYIVSILVVVQLIACSITTTENDRLNTKEQVSSSRSISNNYKVVGYMPSWSGNVAEIQYDKLTHINYSFLLPNADGSLKPIERPNKLKDLVARSHNSNVKVLIAVGGWNGGNDSAFETIARNPSLRKNFITNLMNFVHTYNLDGIDMDWEYPDPGASAKAFTLLMRELATELHAKGKLLTAAVVGQGYTGGGVETEVFSFIDFINIMSYDGGNGATHSPYSYAESTLNYWLGRGLPKEKAILGLPFYSRPGWMPYRVLVANNPLAPTMDFIDGQHYNGIATIKSKTELAKNLGGGVMMWELSQDTTDNTSLLTAINEVIGKPIIPDNEKPTTPLGVVGSTTPGKILLKWEPSTDNIGIYGYNVYLNAKKVITLGASTNTVIENIEAGNYSITITAIDRSGNESLHSKAINLKVTKPISIYADWNSKEIYVGGMRVFHNNKDWEAKWWNLNQEPGKDMVWKLVK